MTEYWVSQAKHYCDVCKLFVSNNTISIRNHELGTKHKENVANRLTNMRKDKAAKDKEQKDTARALEQIEAKAQRSYQKDVSAVKDARISESEEWEYDKSSGYYFNQSNGCYYDQNSGFYYTDSLGKWVTKEEALAASQASTSSTSKKPILKNPRPVSESKSVSGKSSSERSQSGPPPGRVVSNPMNPTRSLKGAAPSSLTLNKRKRQDQKPKALSEEEKAALKAREAARKRVEEREASLLGLYR